jgi:hypothetical protein
MTMEVRRMSEDRSDMGDTPDIAGEAPLPREWLPDGVEAEGHEVWEARTARVLAFTSLEWRRAEGRARAMPWLTEVGHWVGPAAALAAAAAALLLVGSNRAATLGRTPQADAVALSLVATGGDPVALWAALGVNADPVLALLTLEDHTGWMSRPDRAGPGPGDVR